MSQVNPQKTTSHTTITDQSGFSTSDILTVGGKGALSVAVLDGSGNQVVSFGGGTGGSGTQYVDSAASGLAPTGTLTMGWDSGNALVRALKVDASQNLSVSVANFPGTQTIAGSVSVSNFPATQPVSGTFWQSTQPVSLASLPALVAGTATIGSVKVTDGTNLMPTGDSSLRSLHTTLDNASVAVTGTFWQATQPVSGTFWQATQPVSGTVTANVGTTNGLALDATLANVQVATGTVAPTKIEIVGGKTSDVTPQYQPIPLTAAGAAVKVDGSATTQPVSGTFWQATQPVSGTFFQATQPVSGTVTAAQATAANLNATVVQATAANLNVTAAQGGTWTVQPGNTANTTAWLVNGPTVTKGTQAAVGFTVQDLKDAGRTYIAITLDAAAGVTTEALVTMSINKAGTVTTGTSYTVTSGKTLRLQSISVAVRATSTTALTAARVRLRTAASAIAASSPLLATLDCTPPTAAALAGATGEAQLMWPDGLEIAATQQIGVSQIVSSTSSAVTVTLIGYEY